MADNAIDLIVAKEAYAQLDKLITGLNEVDAKVADTVAKANAQFKNMGSITTPSMSGDNSAQMAELNQKIKELSETTKKYETQIKALSEAKKTYSRTVSQESVDTTIANKNAREAFQATSKLISEYDKLDLAHKKAMKSAQAIGAQYGSTSKEFLQASVNFKKLDDEIKAIDATLGKNNRNVGNYKSGFNGLSNSINQLTREAPAFANSIGTGFMALSNNIPILADEIANLAEKNKMLVASGQPTQSMFKTLTSAIFSWQTALSVGVTLLTIYGAELIDLAFGASASEKAFNKLNGEIKNINSLTDENTVSLQTNLEIVKDTNLSDKERLNGLKNLKESIPELSKINNLNADSIALITFWTNKQIEASLARMQADAYIKLLSQSEIENNKENSKTLEESVKWYEKVLGLMGGSLSTQASIMMVKRLTEERGAREKNIESIKKLAKQSLINAEGLEAELLHFKKKTASTKESNKEQEKHIQLTTNSQKAIDENVKALKEQLANVDKSSDAFRMLNGLIGLVEASTKNLSKLADTKFPKPELPTEVDFVPPVSKDQEDQTEWLKQYAIDQAEFLKKQEEIKKYISSFADEFASNSGLTETFKMLNGDIEGFGEKWQVTAIAIAESAQEMFNFISNASQQNFQAEYARLESQKEIAIGFAGDSAVAKDKIEKDTEKKKKEIANRENKAKQKQAIFNIAIDTAQAIIATLAKTPPPAGIPMALFVGALGAVQIGMVASQKIPQYFDGTDNHTGGLMLVNDGKGSNYKEKVVLPNGQVILPQDRNVLMEAPKGTKVLNHEQQLFEMLQGKGVSMSVAQSQGMTADEMDMILAKHFSGIKTHNTTIDKNGFNSYIRNGNSITRMNSNRSQGIGLSV